MKRKIGPAYVTVAEAALLIGVTPAAVHKRIRLGTIDSTVSAGGQRILKRDGLERRWWGSTQRLADMPAHGREVLSWHATANRLNSYLGDHWPPPPWDGDQVATLSLLLEMAQHGS